MTSVAGIGSKTTDECGDDWRGVHTSGYCTGDEYIRVPRGQETSTYDRRRVHTSSVLVYPSYPLVCTDLLLLGTDIYLYVLVCTRLLSYVLIYLPLGTRMYSSLVRYPLVCTRLQSYVLVCSRLHTRL